MPYPFFEGRQVMVSFRQYGNNVLVNISNGKRGLNLTREMAVQLHDDLEDALREYPAPVRIACNAPAPRTKRHLLDWSSLLLRLAYQR